jgi:DNA recombination protein RmuC
MMPIDFIASSIALLLGLMIGFFISRAKSAGLLAKQETLVEQKRAELEQLNQASKATETKLGDAIVLENSQVTAIAVAKTKVDILTGDLADAKELMVSEQSKVNDLRSELSKSNGDISAANAKLQSGIETDKERQERIQTLEDKLIQQQNKVTMVEDERNQFSEKLATQETTLHEKEKQFKAQLAQIDEQKGIMKTEFQNLANEILEAKGVAFNELNKKSLNTMLNPFKQQINDFKGKVENLHLEGTKQQSAMKTELKHLQDMHQTMTQEAHNLATALQGQRKVQGNWGELILENVLDRSGLILGKDYKREDSFNYEEGNRGRPDAVIYLPQDKHLIIDAKVSLSAYTRFVNSEDEQVRERAIKEHVQAFSDRIQELSAKNYYKLNGINSPEMVFMFVPIESAFVEAMKADEMIFQKAIENNVLVATPTTLLTSLNIVRQLWHFENQNKHTAELVSKAEGVYKKLKTFLSSFEGIKKSLDNAQDSYSKAEGQLVSGRGNLVKQVNDFKELAPTIKDQLPQYFVDKAELELNPKVVEK